MTKYAICNELYEGWELAEICKHAKARGYSGLELAPFTLGSNPVELSDGERKQIRSTLSEHDMAPVGLHWLLAKTDGFCVTSADADVRKRTAGYLSDLAVLCSDLGGEVMVFGSPQQRNFPPSMTYQEAERNALDVLESVAPTLGERNVKLVLEPLGPEEGNFMLTAESAIRLIEQLKCEQIQLHLDVKAMATESKPIAQVIEESADYLVHFHANDPNRLGPGMGDVDYGPIFESLRNVGYEGWMSVEVFDYSPGIDALVEQSIEYMQTFE